MKFPVILSTLAVAQAIVIPDAAVFNEIKLEEKHPDRFSWLEDAPSNAVASAKKKFENIKSDATEAIYHAKDSAKTEWNHILEEESEVREAWNSLLFGDLGDHDTSEYTIYELISKCDKTGNFSKIVDKHENVVKLLNDTDADLTLFVPVDEAFAHIPKDHEKPSKEFVEDFLNYHVALGEYDARKIVRTHTIATALKEKYLGDKPQRVRVSWGFGGVRVNFYSKVIAADFVSFDILLSQL